MTFDEGYGGKPQFLRELTMRKQRYVAEVPRIFTGWLDPPRVVMRPYHKDGRGRGRKVPRLASGSPPARRVDHWLDDPTLRDQPWKRYRVKDGEKGPMIWECKHVMLTAKGADGLPGETLHLIVARDVLNPADLKFFVSNAPSGTSVATLLLVAFLAVASGALLRGPEKRDRLGSVRGKALLGLKRHMIISCVSHLFLARVRQEWAGEKTGTDNLPAAHGDGGVDPVVGVIVTPVEGQIAGQGSQKNQMGRSVETHRLGRATSNELAAGCANSASNSPISKSVSGTRLSAVELSAPHVRMAGPGPDLGSPKGVQSMRRPVSRLRAILIALAALVLGGSSEFAREAALMVWLAAATALSVIAAVDIWTIRAISHVPSPRAWRTVAIGLLTIGIALGIYLGCFFTYQVAPDLRYIGFPAPGLVLHLEKGHWVDYVGPIGFVLPFNVFAVASCCLLPVSGCLLVRHLAVGWPPRPSDAPHVAPVVKPRD